VKIDLHLHTTYSDGILDPDDLLVLSREKGYDVISITDHDNIEGYLSVKDKAPDYNLTIIPGVEISSKFEETEVHILAYFFDDTHPSLLSLLDFINENRINRARAIVDKLSGLGVKLDIETLLSTTGKSGIVGRLHIARALVDNNYCSSIREAFDRYLHDRSPAFEPKVTLPAEKTIPMIQSAGGISVLAHPHKLDNISVVLGLIDLGINGLEVYCPKSSSYAVSLFEQLAREHELLTTGGSDFHGEQEEFYYYGKFSVPEEAYNEFYAFHEMISESSYQKNKKSQQ